MSLMNFEGIKISENKRRREELELEALENENRERKQQGVLTFINTMQLLDPDWKKDTRLVIQTKDYFKNISLGQKLLTSGSPALTKDQDMPCYIQEVGWSTPTRRQTRSCSNVRC